MGILALFGLTCCVPRSIHPQTLSWGVDNYGVLLDGESLPDQSLGFVRARPAESTRFGVPTLVRAIQRAAQSVHQKFPGSYPLKIGDLSGPWGGKHPRHGSHRTGRDIDIVYYAVDSTGRSVPATSFVAFDRHGQAVGKDQPEIYFDERRNWHLMRLLLTDPEIQVQWIFCSHGIKTRLLRYATMIGESPQVLARAAWVLHRPTNARPHDDHFHMRIMCSVEQRASGCWDRPPFWPWDRVQNEQRSVGRRAILSDERVVAELMRQ